MARQELGPKATRPDDTVDRADLDESLATKYTKPTDGIPGTDIADHAVGVEKIDADGAPTAAKVLYGDGRWSVIIGNSILVEPDSDYLVDLPVETMHGELVLYEIRPPTDTIVVTFPDGLRLVGGMPTSLTVPPGVSGYIGIRWSDAGGYWTCLGVALETF